MFKMFVSTLALVFTAQLASAQRYIFTLHGKIIEDQGPNVVETVNGFGPYKYDELITALRKEKFTVITEYRKKNTDVKEYAAKVARQVDSLLRKGVPAGNITVMGASKGAMIAMYVSSILKNDKVNFVFLSACNDDNLYSNPGITFCGNILSIYETSDNIGGSCAKFKAWSALSIPHYKEIPLSTGLRHGYFYKPLPVWLNPAIAWANGNYK